MNYNRAGIRQVIGDLVKRGEVEKWIEHYEERVAIMIFDGGLPENFAESQALECVKEAIKREKVGR